MADQKKIKVQFETTLACKVVIPADSEWIEADGSVDTDAVDRWLNENGEPEGTSTTAFRYEVVYAELAKDESE